MARKSRNARTAGDKGHPATREFWQSALALCRFDYRKLSEIEIHPIEMGFGRPRSQRGRPMLADDREGKAILDRIARLSRDLGTNIEQRDGRGIIRL